MGHPVNWFQISGGDGAALTKFYQTVFAWRMGPAPGPGNLMLVEADPPDGIAGGIGASPDGSAGVVVYVGVEDIEAALAKVGAAGGSTFMPKMDLPDGWGSIALFKDPAGNVTGLWQSPKKRPEVAARKAKNAKPPKAKAAAKKPVKADKAAKKAEKKAAKKTAKKTAEKDAKKTAKKKKK